MPDAPPTSPGPMSRPAAPTGARTRIVLGMAICGSCVVIACFATPLAMDSNIWPIAGVFWSVLTVPVAALLGGLCGWLLKKIRLPIAAAILAALGVMLAIAVGMIIARNR